MSVARKYSRIEDAAKLRTVPIVWILGRLPVGFDFLCHFATIRIFCIYFPNIVQTFFKLCVM